MSILNSRPAELKREIGVVGLTSNIINSVIGAGIFVLPAIVAEKLGTASIVAYLFCAVLIACIMLCFAELGSSITKSGGAYSYIEVAFGKYAGFLATNLFVLGVTVLASAAIANALADTISYKIPLFADKVFRAFFFFVVFGSLALLNVRGVKHGIALVKIATLAKLTPLIFLIIMASMKLSGSMVSWDSMPAASSFGQVSLILFFAFQGAENSLSVGGEIKNPSRTIPKAILFGFIIILIVYIGIQIISQGVLGESLPDFKTAPLAEVAGRIIGPHGIAIMVVGACVSMFGYLSGDILNMPRVIYAAARDKVIPLKIASRIHPTYATPTVSIILFTSLVFIFSVTGNFKQLAILSSASILLIYLGVAMALLKLRNKTKNHPNSFRVPGGIIIPVFTIPGILWLLSNLSTQEILSICVFISVLSIIYGVIIILKKSENK